MMDPRDTHEDLVVVFLLLIAFCAIYILGTQP